MSTDDISKYSELWTDIDNYALVLIPESISKKSELEEKYYICKKYPGGYIDLLFDPIYINPIVNKMLAAGVKILKQEDVLDANQPHHLWTDRLHESVLVRSSVDSKKYRIYNLKFKKYLNFAIWIEDITWDTVIQKMIENGVEIVDEAELDEMINNNPI